MFTNEELQHILLEAKAVDPKEVAGYLEHAAERGVSLEQYLTGQKIISEEQLYQAAASVFGLPFTNLKNVTIRKDVLFLIPEPMAAAHHLIAYDKTDEALLVACLNPEDLQLAEFLRKKTGLEVKLSLTTPDAIAEAMKAYHKGLRAEFEEIKPETPGAAEGGKLKELAQDLPVIRIVDTLLEYAILENASDIHIEPSEKQVSVRYRVDGVLRNVMTLPKSVHPGITARIKILADLKIDEHRLPQDGRFKVETEEQHVSFRVSIIPTYDGEKIVLRLLNEKTSLLTLEQLGFQPSVLEVVQRNIDKPHGMLLVTGPTGSGKTTTLYAILNVLNTPEVNITTIEDPIEYRMNGINQSQVNPKIGYTFAVGLRAYLRQDPDIIMVGEIRDQETAVIAIHAALTGHLVLSTLHTNDAPTTLPRLNEMGVPAFLVSTTTNLIVAQRLVRKICKECIQSYTLSKTELKEIEAQVDLEAVMASLERQGVVGKQQSRDSLLFYRGKGCKACGKEGYRGRLGIYEVLEVTPKISELVLKNAPSKTIRDTAREEGMLTILEDGFIKAKAGITTIEEILRVTKD